MSRTVAFPPDGHRLYAAPAAIVAAWRAATSKIPAEYALGTAQHETSFTLNEVDTEPSGFVSKGIFQLSDEEAKEAGQPCADLLELEVAVAVLARIAEHRLTSILLAAKLNEPTPDVWAYLALAHNQGLGACLRTIVRYGLDWADYKARNPQLDSMARYGDDCISGGEKKWAAATAA